MQDYNSCDNLIEEEKNISNIHNQLIHEFNYIFHPENQHLTPLALHQQNYLQHFPNSLKEEDIESEIDPKSQKRERKNRKEGPNRNVNKGHWTHQQNKKYHLFLQIHYKHFVNRHMRRMDKIFKTMELFIGTRQAEQCRSHHQKMQKKYHIFTNIIENLRKGHFETLDIEPILEDLKRDNIQLKDGIKTMQELLSMEQNNKEMLIKIEKREKKEAKTQVYIQKNVSSLQVMDKESVLGVLCGEQRVDGEKEQLREQQSIVKIDMLQQLNNLQEAYLHVLKQQNSSLLFHHFFE